MQLLRESGFVLRTTPPSLSRVRTKVKKSISQCKNFKRFCQTCLLILTFVFQKATTVLQQTGDIQGDMTGGFILSN